MYAVGGGAVLNDSPVGCQTRAVTEPQRDGACPSRKNLPLAPLTDRGTGDTRDDVGIVQ